MAFDRTKFLQRFIAEARENHALAVNGLLNLERDPSDQAEIGDLFRRVHTVKGAARMLGLKPMTLFLHALEDLLSALRDKRITLSKDLTNTLFAAFDEFERLTCQLEQSGEPDPDQTLMEQMAQSLNVDASPITEPAAQKDDFNVKKTKIAKPLTGAETIRIKRSRVDHVMKLTGELWTHLEIIKKRLSELQSIANGMTAVTAMNQRPVRDEGLEGSFEADYDELTQRIRSLGTQLRNDIEIQEMRTADLQNGAQKLGLVALSHAFEPLRRIVRDAADLFGKQVELDIAGEDTELDRRLIDLVRAPLEHMVRNAVDHGIELPKNRTKAGKSAAGRIEVSAEIVGGRVRIKVRDDGGGIDLERLRVQAVKRGLVSDSEWQELTQAQRTDFVFAPGLTTAEMVTDWSGRGVGMDVVKRNIVNDLSGSIAVEHTLGEGTCFNITLPQTLAVMQLLAMSVGPYRVGIPTGNIHSVSRRGRTSFIDVVDHTAVAIGDDIVRVVDLEQIYGDSTSSDLSQPIVVVVHSSARFLAIAVEVIEDLNSYVVHPVPDHINPAGLLMGVAIRGEGEIMQILNVSMLVQTTAVSNRADSIQSDSGARSRVLVVDDSYNTREIEKSILEAHGYQVNLAADGQEALDLLNHGEFDLVVSDVEMPHMDGFELTRRIKASDQLSDTPVILLTARASPEDRLKGIDCGASAYLVKHSFEQSNLINTIKNLID